MVEADKKIYLNPQYHPGKMMDAYKRKMSLATKFANEREILLIYLEKYERLSGKRYTNVPPEILLEEP